MRMHTLMIGKSEDIREEFAREVRETYYHVADQGKLACDIAWDLRMAMAAMINAVVRSSVRDFTITENNGGFQTLAVWRKGYDPYTSASEDGVEYVHVFQNRGEAWETLAAILGCGDDETVESWDGNEAVYYRDNGTLGDILSEMCDAEEIVDRTAGVRSSARGFALLFGGTDYNWEGL